LETDSSFYHHEKNVYCVAILLGGKEIISGDSNSTLIHYSLKEDRVLMTDKQAGTVFCVAVNPKEDFAVSGGQYGVIKIFDLSAHNVIRSIDAHTSRISSLSISASGNMIASGGKDSKIALWDFSSGKQIANVIGHSGWIRGLAFSNNDIHLLSGGSEGDLKIWRIS
jgi:WD40 repeat protein